MKNSTYEINQCFGANSIPVVNKGETVTFYDSDSEDNVSANNNAEYKVQLKAYIAKAKEEAYRTAFRNNSIHRSINSGSVANNQGIVTVNGKVISNGTQQPQYNVQTNGMRK